MKIAALTTQFRGFPGIDHLLVHSGQHYDDQLSASFFRDLDLPAPDINLQVGSGSHAFQTAEVMKRLEPVLQDSKPDLVVVVGDVNSTLAAALTAAKMCIPLAHVEAGLRSFDSQMPEEINRKVTDTLADLLFVSEESGVRNLHHEGVPPGRIFMVGNVMIDCLLRHRGKAARSTILRDLNILSDTGCPLPYAVLTLHRPSSVDHPTVLRDTLEAVSNVAQDLPVFFPVHPRTRTRIEPFGLGRYFQTACEGSPRAGVYLSNPMGYLDFLCLMDNARMVLTDSGGIQEETTVLGVPCLTLRENTERPATIREGTNQLVGLNPERVIATARRVLQGEYPKGARPSMWDGRAGERIVRVLLEHFHPELLSEFTANSAHV
jgi:UDP-N-acetylglucosamine 2-epimerase (non-hydrolysing)